MTNEEIANTSAMVNMDTPGLAPSEFWASRADRVLADAPAHIAGELSFPLCGWQGLRRAVHHR